MRKSFEDEALKPQKVTGFWIIPEIDSEKDFWGTLDYDPNAGVAELMIIGHPVIQNISKAKYRYIFGKSTNGKAVTVFDLSAHGTSFTLGSEKTAVAKFSFSYFTIGDVALGGDDRVRFKSFSFRITNLEAWCGDSPLARNWTPARQKVKSVVSFSFPDDLHLFEDENVIIKIKTFFYQNTGRLDITTSFYRQIEIKAKHNRKLPYWGKTNSFSYYKQIIHDFFCLIIGKNAVSFQYIGIVSKFRIPKNILKKKIPNAPELKGRQYFENKVELFYNRILEKKWVERIETMQMLLPKPNIPTNCSDIFLIFFEKYHSFDFVLDDWTRTRNCHRYSNYTLPELLYNLEGLHRNLYPEHDVEPEDHRQQKEKIKYLLNNEDVKFIGDRLDYHFSFRKRLQRIFKLTSKIYPYLHTKEKNRIIHDLCCIRNNAAHSRGEQSYNWNYKLPLIMLVEELLFSLILLQLNCSEEQIYSSLSTTQEYHELKRMLFK